MPSGARFDARRGGFVGAEVPKLDGFDTYWYAWSLTHPETEVLEPGSPDGIADR